MGIMQDKVTIMTGGAGGIGHVAAKLFAEHGAKLVIADMDEKGGNATAEEIRQAGGDAMFVKVNLTNPAEVKNVIDETVKAYGRIDSLVNVAGKQGGGYDIAHMEESQLDAFINVNIKGTWYFMKYAAPELVKTKGSIVNIASLAATLGSFGGTGYGMTKGAIISMTYAVANELGIYGVRCNAISPCITGTDYCKSVTSDEWFALRMKGNALRRIAEPIDIANAMLFLASDKAASCTGMNMLVDCGASVLSQPFVMEDFLPNNRFFDDDGAVLEPTKFI